MVIRYFYKVFGFSGLSGLFGEKWGGREFWNCPYRFKFQVTGCKSLVEDIRHQTERPDEGRIHFGLKKTNQKKIISLRVSECGFRNAKWGSGNEILKGPRRAENLRKKGLQLFDEMFSGKNRLFGIGF